MSFVLTLGFLVVCLYQACSPFEIAQMKENALSAGTQPTPAPTPPGPNLNDVRMSFFITSASLSRTGNLGGIVGADSFCNMLGTQAGVPGNWKAYLSRTNPDGTSLENARDRIGVGPWFNRAGVMIAANLTQLHNVVIPPNLVLNDLGAITPGNVHDILTGSDAQGRAAPDNCGNWTSNNPADSGVVGHSDLMGGPNPTQSWNAQHSSRCDQNGLQSTGGAGLFHCFRIR